MQRNKKTKNVKTNTANENIDERLTAKSSRLVEENRRQQSFRKRFAIYDVAYS